MPRKKAPKEEQTKKNIDEILGNTELNENTIIRLPLTDSYLRDDIDKIYDEIWSRLKIGKKDRNSEFHQCYVASTGNEFPSVRTVVLRHVNKDQLTIGFHTDVRSNKINDINNNSNVTVLLYDHAAKIQVKINGIA